MKRIFLYVVLAPILLLLFIRIGLFVYQRIEIMRYVSDYKQEAHPNWSHRENLDYFQIPNIGSGNGDIVFIVDVRKVDIPVGVALKHYDDLTKKSHFWGFKAYSYSDAASRYNHILGFKKIHSKVDSYHIFIVRNFPESDLWHD